MPLIHLIPLVPMRGDERAEKIDASPPTLARQCPFILLNPAHLTAQRRTNLLHDVTNNAAINAACRTRFRTYGIAFFLVAPFGYLPFIAGSGGARRDRTDDLKLAKLPLSQLSYGPSVETKPA